MTAIGRDGAPLRVAIVGSGPAGFYVAEHLLAADGRTVEIDMYERLPMPFGLVRYGVAPDHEKIKNVTRTFEKKVASRPAFRFYGNVEIGRDLTLDDLRTCYHQVCFASGAQTDRHLGIPGEDLAGSHPATAFVAWYNGHPDYRDATFDLSAKRVAVIGVGNVAVDVARMLCRTPDELARTDTADYAQAALAAARIQHVTMLGRRGPLQAAFTNPEVRELGQLPGADIAVRPEEIALDPLSREALEQADDRSLRKKMEILEGFAAGTPAGRDRTLTLRFLVSPTELIGDDHAHVRAMRIVRNTLVRGDGGALRPRPTDTVEELPVDLVFRSVGYRGLPIPGLPFDDRRGVVPNDAGRVVDPDRERTPVPGIYVSGWIKRGPSGVIGTNKPDALETVRTMLADLDAGSVLTPATPDPEAARAVVETRQPGRITWDDWQRLDTLERAAGEARGCPRVKFTSAAEALAALGR